jgi:predicted nucleotidyltransferase
MGRTNTFSNPTLEEIRRTLQDHLPELQERYGVTVIGIFGSYARGESRPDSDLDILVELEEPPRIGLIGLVNLENYLSDLLGVPVQVTLQRNLKPRLRPRVLQEMVPVR